MGTFYIATSGGSLPAGTNIGSLWVHYEFQLLQEQLAPAPNIGTPMLYQAFIPEGTGTGTGLWKKWQNGTIRQGPDLGITFDDGAIHFPNMKGRTFTVNITWVCDEGTKRGEVWPNTYPYLAMQGGDVHCATNFHMIPQPQDTSEAWSFSYATVDAQMSTTMFVNFVVYVTEQREDTIVHLVSNDWPSRSPVLAGCSCAITITEVNKNYMRVYQ